MHVLEMDNIFRNVLEFSFACNNLEKECFQNVFIGKNPIGSVPKITVRVVNMCLSVNGSLSHDTMQLLKARGAATAKMNKHHQCTTRRIMSHTYQL